MSMPIVWVDGLSSPQVRIVNGCLHRKGCIYLNVQNCIQYRYPAGDIADMWIRDSSVQIGIYLSKMKDRPSLRLLVEGVLRTQAFFIVQDPYANAFSPSWRVPSDLAKFERLIGRGGWVGTRNYELDSSAYFVHFLWNYLNNPYVHSPSKLLDEDIIFDAVGIIVDIWITEQNHETDSPYRYSELSRKGLGGETGYTGMTWSGFRPSDDPNEYGYSIPSNVYAAAALYRLLDMNTMISVSYTHLRAHET